MSAARTFILAWLLFSAILGGRCWSPPGGFRHALDLKHAIAGGLRANAQSVPYLQGAAPRGFPRSRLAIHHLSRAAMSVEPLLSPSELTAPSAKKRSRSRAHRHGSRQGRRSPRARI